MNGNECATQATEDPHDGACPENGLDLVILERGLLTRRQLGAARSFSIGRRDDCDIVLRDPAASRRHALLHVSAGASIEDLDSRNGTKLNGVRLASGRPVAVRPGDSVQIGGAVFILDAQRGATAVTSSSPCALERGPVVSHDPAMRAAYELVASVGPSMLTVLVVGETGVGKELIAEALHRQSGPRSAKPLMRINCAALAPALLESELFGHERGAFTGAQQARAGLFEAADGGTVFLDEIGELPADAQAKLLRVLETREVTRVGGVRPRPLDVRFVAATHRNLRACVARGAFREDLYFRLAGTIVRVPPLRQRPADIEPLVAHFVNAVCRQMGRERPSLTADATAWLRSHSWPGNVRELRNVVESAVLRARGSTIALSDLALDSTGATGPDGPPAATSSLTIDACSGGGVLDGSSMRERIVAALAACHGNQTRAAEWLQMPRRTFVRKLAALGIAGPRRSQTRPEPSAAP